jgi:hypothetical protein
MDTFFGEDIPLMHGNSTIDVTSHRHEAMNPSIGLTIGGAVEVHVFLAPHNARALAAQLIAAADYAEDVS